MLLLSSSEHARRSKSSLRLTWGLFTGLRGNPNAAEGPENSSFLHLQQVAPSSDFHNRPGRSKPVAPAFDHGRVTEFWVCRLRRWLCMGGGASHAFFFFFFSQGASKAALSLPPSLPLAGAAGRCPQLRKLPVSTNQPHIQTSRCGIRSGAASYELFPECLRDSQTWLRQKKKRKRNTRQGDRQKNKEEKR